jgi:hypothetical protein
LRLMFFESKKTNFIHFSMSYERLLMYIAWFGLVVQMSNSTNGL